jgi:hypothetical protein
MRTLELTSGQIYSISDDATNGLLNLNVDDLFKFKLYKGFTLNDVLNTLDLSISDIELDTEEVFDEICFEGEGDYSEFAETELCNDSINFLESFLKRLNKNYLESCDNNIIDGELPMFMLIRFYADEDELNTETMKRIKDVKSFSSGNANLLDEIDSQNDEIFWIIQLSTFCE